MIRTLLIHLLRLVTVLTLIMANTTKAASPVEETSSTQMPAFLDFINPFIKPSSGAEKNTDDEFKTVKPKRNTNAGNVFFALAQWTDAYLQKQEDYLTSNWFFPAPCPAWVSSRYIDLYTSPSEQSAAFYIVEKDEQIILLKTEAHWVKIQAADGTLGWAESSHLLSQLRFSPPAQTETQAPNNAHAFTNSVTPTPLELSLGAGDFEHNTFNQLTLSRALSPHFFLSLSGADIMNTQADTLFVEASARYYPSLPFRFSPYFRLGMGRFFHPDAWARVMMPKDAASFVTVGLGADFPLTSQLRLRLDASNYSADLGNSALTSMQAYSLSLAFRPEQTSVQALQQIMNQTLHHNDSQIGLFTGLYLSNGETKTKGPVKGLHLNYLLSTHLFVESAWAETDLESKDSQHASLSYYRLSLAYIAHRGDYVFANQNWRTQAWLQSGLGNTRFSGQSHATAHMGLGFSLQANDYLSCRVLVLDHILQDSLLENSKISHTPEPSIGIALHF